MYYVTYSYIPNYNLRKTNVLLLSGEKQLSQTIYYGIYAYIYLDSLRSRRKVTAVSIVHFGMVFDTQIFKVTLAIVGLNTVLMMRLHIEMIESVLNICVAPFAITVNKRNFFPVLDITENIHIVLCGFFYIT